MPPSLMSNPPSNYASVDDTFRVSAKRFARSPWLSSYITSETVLGVYSDRFFPLTIGAEALRTADRRSAFFGVRSDPGTPPGRHRVRHEGRTVGRLTAAARSPHLQSTIGYVRFDSPREWEGEQVSLEAADGTLYPARVVALPFYDAEKRIPRGLDGAPP